MESALLEHPAVVESAVVSSPDDVRGEVRVSAVSVFVYVSVYVSVSVYVPVSVYVCVSESVSVSVCVCVSVFYV